MKNALYHLLLALLLLFSVVHTAYAQYTLSGKVTDENGQAISGATVFISGSQRITATDNAGSYILSNVDAGTMQLSVKMLGFTPFTKNVFVQDKSVIANITLVVKAIVLNEVNIGNSKGREANLKLFKRQFFGNTPNANTCVIINPDVISFSTRKGFNGKLTLSAESEDFMVIENKALGYRINYLLKSFTTTGLPGITNYDGDCSFIEMEGTPEIKKKWEENRLNAYHGSLMHYLRSVFSNTTLDEGFLTYPMFISNGKRYIEKRQVKFDTLVTAVDTSFISLKFKAFYVIYDPENTAKTKQQLATGSEQATAAFTALVNANNSQGGSQLVLTLKEVIVDAKGRFNDYRAFLIREKWVENRIGDQLPFEYQPPKP